MQPPEPTDEEIEQALELHQALVDGTAFTVTPEQFIEAQQPDIK